MNRLELADISPTEDESLPPHSDAAEAGVLGCVLLSPLESMDVIASAGIGSDWFYDLRHRTVYNNITALHEAGTAIDAVTVTTRLLDRKEMADAGGLVYLTSLPDSTPSAANIAHYIDILRSKFAGRKLIQLAAKLKSDVYTSVNIQALVDESYRGFDEIAQIYVATDKAKVKPIREVLVTSADRYERLLAGDRRGIQTGFVPIDAVGGFAPGEMVLIAGETKIGKSTFALNLLHGALKSGTKVAVFSLEMNDQAWCDRLLSLDLEIDRRAFRVSSYMTAAVIQKVADNLCRIGRYPLWVCDDAAIKTSEIERVLTKLSLSEGIEMFVVDYAQLVSPNDERDSREQQVAKIGRNIRRICQKQGLVALVLSQLNDEGKVRESRALLHECHLGFVMEEREGDLWIRQAAGRDVAVPDFPVEFDGTICRIRQKSQMNNGSTTTHNDP